MVRDLYLFYGDFLAFYRGKKSFPLLALSTENVGGVVGPQPLKPLSISKEEEESGGLSNLRSRIWGPGPPSAAPERTGEDASAGPAAPRTRPDAWPSAPGSSGVSSARPGKPVRETELPGVEG